MPDALPTGRLSVRPAVTTDAAAIDRVRIETWRHTYRDMLPETVLRGLDQDKAIAFLQSAIDGRKNENRLLSGFSGNRLCGFALWNRHAENPTSIAELRALYVLPSHQGSGLGTALFDRCRQDMRDAGFSAFVVYTLETNRPAREFYRRRGATALPGHRRFDIAGASLPEVGYRVALV